MRSERPRCDRGELPRGSRGQASEHDCAGLYLDYVSFLLSVGEYDLGAGYRAKKAKKGRSQTEAKPRVEI